MGVFVMRVYSPGSAITARHTSRARSVHCYDMRHAVSVCVFSLSSSSVWRTLLRVCCFAEG